MDPKTSATSLFRQTGPSVDPVAFRPEPNHSHGLPLPVAPLPLDANAGHHDDDPRRAASLPHHLAVRHPSRLERLPGALSARLPAPQRVGVSVPRRRHHRRLAVEERLVLAAGAQRRRAESAAQGAQRHAGDLRARQSRRSRAPVLRPRVRRHPRARRGVSHDARRQASVDRARRSVRRRDPARQVARLSRRHALHADPDPEPLVQPDPQRGSASRTGRCRST